VHTQHNYFVMV